MRQTCALAAKAIFAMAGLVLGVSAMPALATTMQIQNGLSVAGGTYSGTETTWLHSGSPDSTTIGTNTILRVGYQDQSPSDYVFRTLVRFGALSHFAGVTEAQLGFSANDIVGARIKLFASGGEGSGAAEIHILDSADQDWTESYTNWNWKRWDSDPDQAWSQGPGVGNAYGPIIGSSQAFSSPTATGTATTFELTGNADAMQLVKDWFSGADTSGTFFVRATTESGTGNNYFDWKSEQFNTTPSYRPMLEVDYVVPEPASILTFSLAAAGLLALRRR